MKNIFVTILCVLGISSLGNAQTFNQWIASSESSWFVAADWAERGVPNSSNGALLSTDSAACDVDDTGAVCEDLLVDGGTLNIEADSDLSVSDTGYIGGEPGFGDFTSYVNVEGGDFTVDTLNIGTGTAYGQLGMSAGTVNISSLNLGSNGLINIDGGAIYITYPTGADPIAAVRTLLAASYANTWAAIVGNIVSTYCNTNHSNYAIGYADSADPGNPAGLPANTIKIMATLIDDSNLDGTVSGDDYTIVVSHLGHSVSGWDQGDFEYNGVCNGDDYTAVVSHLGDTSALPTN